MATTLSKRLLLVVAALTVGALVVFVPDLLSGTSGISGAGLSFDEAMHESWWLAFGVVFLGGVLTSLTPCVYPLIPITVSIFGARSAGTRLKGAFLSGIYVLGMAVMYSVLGLVAALTGKVFGSVMSNPWVMGAIALLFTLFAASMLGAFQIRLPGSLQARLSQVGGEGTVGAFAMGLVAGVVAAPCTGPVLGGVLTYVATTGDAVLGVALLFTFAIGMGLLFFVLGTFSVNLPKSGTWMEVVESVFGIALLVVALVFLSGAVPALRKLGIQGTWAPWLLGALVATGILAGGVHRSFHGAAVDKAAKGVGVLLIVAAIFLRLHSGHPPATQLHWLKSEAEAVALGAREGRPVMIDFNAEWCAACKELERITFPDPAVSAELQRFVVASVDLTDDDSPEYERLQKKYGFPGLPYVVFYDSKGKLRSELTVTGFRKPEAFVKILRHVE